MADPASHRAVMAWIMEELAKSKFRPEAGKDKRTRGRFSRSPLTSSESEDCQKALVLTSAERNVRFP